MENVVDRFIRYVKIDTCSDEESTTHPSTLKQHDLASLLVQELTTLGAQEITYDQEHCYVYASIPASPGYEAVPVVGFIAHMDTSPAMSGTGVKPRIVKAYDGKDIVLNPELGIILKTEEFPEICGYKGKDLIVTDGTTLLGADDKAGIAEIMTMAEYYLTHPNEPHGKLRIGFTPDEEIGAGTDFFDVKLFGADVAYTVDGGALGELEYENFNAAGAKVHFQGRSVHPGYAKGKMKNALAIALHFHRYLPIDQDPEHTEGYEGFYHLDSLNGTVESADADYIIRDHDRAKFEKRKIRFQAVAEFLNREYGEGTITIDMKDSYYNMREIMEDHMDLIDKAVAAMEEQGIDPLITPIRGGTDGAKLSFMGLPCPNICTGGENYHGKYEYVCVQSMEKIVNMLIGLVKKF